MRLFGQILLASTFLSLSCGNASPMVTDGDELYGGFLFVTKTLFDTNDKSKTQTDKNQRTKDESDNQISQTSASHTEKNKKK